MASTQSASLTREELVHRATALVPVLKERASGTERSRQIPPEMVQELIASGLIRIGTPERYGGYAGMDYDAMFDVGWELGRGCGSTAWCYSVWTVHNWIVGHFPEQGQEEFFATGPDTICSSGFFPEEARSEAVDGGFRVSGRWSFSSGCDAATWAMLGTPGPHGLVWNLVPRSDYEIVDNWFVSGMGGTGSKDIVIQEAIIPPHRRLEPGRAGDGNWTGWELHERLSYRPPLRCLLGWDLASPLIGMAQGAVDELTTRLRGTSGLGRTADSVAVQLRLAEASAEVDAARLLHRHTIRDILEKAARAEAFPEADRTRYQRDKAFVVKLCVQAVNRLFEASGAHALFDSEPVQRFHRDVHGASHQRALNWDAAGEQYGRVALGLAPLPRPW